ncbi:MAG: hypothetical protein BGO14_09295 [Chlamydiales bacterium 38-26]|nr:MAG: hypothetical protein BGO14_09295 [Chlamydiales bacterium 38-26]
MKIMQNLYQSRYGILLIILVSYLLPLMLMSSYGMLYMPPQKGWNLWTFGLFFSILGTLGLFWILCRFNTTRTLTSEDNLEDHQEVLEVPSRPSNIVEIDTTHLKALEDLQQDYQKLHQQWINVQTELDHKIEDYNHLHQTYQETQTQLEQCRIDSRDVQQKALEDLDQQKQLVLESQKTIASQREDLDKKLQLIAQLETKVSDLTYEIKTLLQLVELAELEKHTLPIYPTLPVENHPSSSISSKADEEEYLDFHLTETNVQNESQAILQLRKCIDIAQKITGANYYNNSQSRFKDLAIDNYALDLRRLFESLRLENASVIIFYSHKENKVLFVNNQSRHLLGWSPDKFVQSFNDILEPSKEEWKLGISSLAIKNDVSLCLKMKNKTGSLVDVQALLGIIPTGIFRQHILGVLYQKSKEFS